MGLAREKRYLVKHCFFQVEVYQSRNAKQTILIEATSRSISAQPPISWSKSILEHQIFQLSNLNQESFSSLKYNNSYST